ncbi:hypothetical protein J2Z69_001059 [Paenibacillus shirakamiensis]|uniref:DUF3784 domain-containing protein n=1 Tax=Paenibacillus shirakamiensis TaxID=1265935 RepID=A0ABS4JEC1_9BACL|nr:hypothetical protein [Paenibacillus shirakamiensis]
MWFKILILLGCWGFGYYLFKSGWMFNKEKQKKVTILDTAFDLPFLLSDSFFGLLISLVVNMILGFFIKHFPWWINKILLFVTSILSFIIGMVPFVSYN